MVRDEQLREARAAGGHKSQENPNVPRPNPTRVRREDIHAGIHEGPTEGGDGVPSPAVAVASASKNTRAKEYAEDFEVAWAAYPKRAGGNSKPDAYQKYVARLKSGATHEELLAGVQRYARFAEASGNVGTPYVMQAVRFFGPGEHFRQPWDVAGLPGAPGLPPGVNPEDRLYNEDGQPTAAGRAMGL